MTIYDAIKERLEKGEKEVPVTSIISGKGYCRSITDNSNIYRDTWYSIRVDYTQKDDYDYYERNGKIMKADLYPCLALGHYDSQLETAQAIKDQNFDTEGV